MRWAGTMAMVLALILPWSAHAAGYLGVEDQPPPLAPVVRDVDLEEHLGQSIDPSLQFTDMNNRRVVLADYFTGNKPVILALAYYRCPMLCGLVLHGLAKGMKPLDMKLGEQYRTLTVSFDPRDTPNDARQKRASVLGELDLTTDVGEAWPFLVGAEPEIRRLADNLGFRYVYDAKTDQYAHPTALFVLTGRGRISRYLYGVDFSPRDLRLAILEAGEGKIGTIVDRILLTCYHFDPVSRTYGPFIVGFIRLGAVLILITVALLLSLLFWGERRRRAQRPNTIERRSRR